MNDDPTRLRFIEPDNDGGGHPAADWIKARDDLIAHATHMAASDAKKQLKDRVAVARQKAYEANRHKDTRTLRRAMERAEAAERKRFAREHRDNRHELLISSEQKQRLMDLGMPEHLAATLGRYTAPGRG